MSGADEVGHIKRDFEGDFHETCILTFLIPRGLVDEFLNPVFFDGVDIFDLCRQQPLRFLAG